MYKTIILLIYRFLETLKELYNISLSSQLKCNYFHNSQLLCDFRISIIGEFNFISVNIIVNIEDNRDVSRNVKGIFLGFS